MRVCIAVVQIQKLVLFFFFSQLVTDKKYMCQVLDIQHMRGATGGDVFARLINFSQPTGSSIF